MGNIHAVIIAVEQYNNAFLKPVIFAEKDARAISAALVDLGCPIENQIILINQNASKTAIEADLKTKLESLVPEDQCFIFFAGHGFSDGLFNYLAAYDTRHNQIEETSVKIQKILGLIQRSRSKKIVLFLDACHTGIEVEESMRSTINGLTDSESFQNEHFCAGFASCRIDQKSYSSIKLQHGIWTYHLLEALSGLANRALEGTYITATSLQQYLVDAVQRTVLAEFSTSKTQTPRFFGSFEHGAIIADLTNILAQKRAKKAGGSINPKRISFVWVNSERVNHLDGYNRKIHFIPDNFNRAAERFIQKIAQNQIKKEESKKFTELRSVMQYENDEIKTEPSLEGLTIRTPGFDYNVYVGQDPEDCACALWRYEITNIRDFSIVESPSFNKIFQSIFNRIEFSYAGKIPDMNRFISVLETLEYAVEFEPDREQCRIQIRNDGPAIEFTYNSCTFEFPKRSPPKELAAEFLKIRSELSSDSSIAKLLAD